MLHVPTNTYIAVKKIPSKFDENYTKQICSEALSLLSCNSPYIIKTQGIHYKNGCYNILLEYMNQGSLD